MNRHGEWNHSQFPVMLRVNPAAIRHVDYRDSLLYLQVARCGVSISREAAMVRDVLPVLESRRRLRG